MVCSVKAQRCTWTKIYAITWTFTLLPGSSRFSFFMKFGIRGKVADIITYTKFSASWFRRHGILTPHRVQFPVACVAIRKVLHYGECDANRRTRRLRKSCCEWQVFFTRRSTASTSTLASLTRRPATITRPSTTSTDGSKSVVICTAFSTARRSVQSARSGSPCTGVLPANVLSKFLSLSIMKMPSERLIFKLWGLNPSALCPLQWCTCSPRSQAPRGFGLGPMVFAFASKV